MNAPFDSELMEDEADAIDALDESPGASAAFDEGDGFTDEFEAADLDSGDDAFLQADAADEDLGDAFAADAGDDAELWNAFEEEVADGLDAADEDEFIGRLLGGLGRAAGVVGRGLGRASGAAGQVGGFARRAGQIAGQVGRVAGRVSPAAAAAARLARMLGAPAGVVNALGTVGRAAQGVRRAAGHAQGLAGSLGQAAGGAEGLFSQLSQLLGGGGADGFDELIDLYEDGVDEALPAVVGMAARAAARGLGFRNVAQMTQAGRRALVRGVASAARELARSRTPQAMRVLPQLAHSAGRVARRGGGAPQRAAQVIRQSLPRTAQRVAQDPRIVRRVTTSSPVGRPASLGRGVRTGGLPPRVPRTFNIAGPVTVTITPR